MPRSAWAVMAGGAVAVLIAAVAALATDRRDLAFANGVAPLEAVVQLAPGQEACQREVAVLAPFAGVRLAADTDGRPGPALEVTVRWRRPGSAGVNGGRVGAGYVSAVAEPQSGPTATLGRIETDSADVCVQNAGERVVGLGGTPEEDPADGRLSVGRPGDLEPARGNLALSFLRAEPTSLLAQLPTAFRRAALFHPPLVGAWTFWLLAALVALGVPALLARSLWAACRTE